MLANLCAKQVQCSCRNISHDYCDCRSIPAETFAALFSSDGRRRAASKVLLPFLPGGKSDGGRLIAYVPEGTSAAAINVWRRIGTNLNRHPDANVPEGTYLAISGQGGESSSPQAAACACITFTSAGPGMTLRKRGMLRMFLKEHCGKLGTNEGLAGALLQDLRMLDHFELMSWHLGDVS